MQKTIVLFFVLIGLHSISAQQSDQKQAIIKVIRTFFDGLHKGDSSVVGKTLHQEVKIQTTGTRQGKKTLKTQSRKELLSAIAQKPATTKYLERLLSYDIKIDGNLASVWTPYEFYLNDTLSHCGANSFQLFDNNGKWEIIYLVDTRRRVGCKNRKIKK